MDNLFSSVFGTSTDAALSVPAFLLCVGVSLAIGLFLAIVYAIRNQYTKSFLMTLALLPAVVCVVIMMVNGNIGAGVAVAGAFSLVRFRSAAGSAKEIAMIFLAMGAGLIAGMGYLAYAALFALILGGLTLVYNATRFGERSAVNSAKMLRITIPEDLDYTTVFDDLLARYTKKHTLVQVKTTNMGSLFRLTYEVTLKNPAEEKKMIDDIRVRNGNLEVQVTRQEVLDHAL